MSLCKILYSNWADGSEYRGFQTDETAEITLANSALHFVNYFEKDIAETALDEDFADWQETAYEIVKIHGTERQTQHEELASEFENQMNEIYRRMFNHSVYGFLYNHFK